ncbi:MAG: MBL fold metallo-hydrolase [Anaerovoracaceae bacterium]
MRITNMPSGALRVNTYLAVDEETNKGMIVDPGGYNKALTDEINKNGIQIEYIVLTHGHSDHICGVNEHKAEFPDAKIIAYKDEAPMLEDPNLNQSPAFGMPYTVKADIFVNDGDKLPLGNLTLKFFHTPGHTKGGMCIYIEKANVLFSGDTLFCQSIGRTDFPGGSFKEISESIKKKLYVLPDNTEVFPGHMGATSIGYEKENNPFVQM